jgi:hypothetical protein
VVDVVEPGGDEVVDVDTALVPPALVVGVAPGPPGALLPPPAPGGDVGVVESGGARSKEPPTAGTLAFG